MATATTTWEAIRDNQITLVHALTPASMTTVKYVVHLDDLGFVDWADAHADAAFRRYSIMDLFEYERPEVTNTDVELWQTQQEIQIAYPLDYRYGGSNRRDMGDIVREDMFQLDKEIGLSNYANYVAGQQSSRIVGTTLTRLDTVAVLSIVHEIIFYRSR